MSLRKKSTCGILCIVPIKELAISLVFHVGLLLSLKNSQHANFEKVAELYNRLLPLNAGAGGILFELLVHMFWRDKVRAAAANTDTFQVEITLLDDANGEDSVTVNCKEFKVAPGSVEF